jgi:hypothetical protein
MSNAVERSDYDSSNVQSAAPFLFFEMDQNFSYMCQQRSFRTTKEDQEADKISRVVAGQGIALKTSF